MNQSPLVLAYIGDAVYELEIRKWLVSKGITKVKELQQSSISYVSAKSQRIYLEALIDNSFLTEEEIEVYKHGRNAHGGKSRHADIVTYRIATGFECLIGYLYLNNKNDRIKEIISFIVGEWFESIWKKCL